MYNINPTPVSILDTLLTSPANVAIYMGSTDYTDNQITQAITAVSGMIGDYCNREFQPTLYTEFQRLAGTNTVNLKQYPVISISSVGFGLSKSDTPTPITDYYIDVKTGILDTRYCSWGWLKITYNAGFDIIPAGLESLAIEMTSAFLQNSEINPLLASEKIGDYQYNKAVTLSDFLVPWIPRLDTYRKGVI